MSSGSEMVPSGPMDVVYGLNTSVTQYVNRIRDTFGPNDVASLMLQAPYVRELGQASPLLGQAVTVEGEEARVFRGVALGKRQRIIMPSASGVASISGIYMGYDLFPVVNPATKRSYVEPVHAIMVSRQERWNEYGMEEYKKIGYICVKDAQIAPIYPENAHTYNDIRSDPLIIQLKKVVSSPEKSLPMKMVTITNTMNRELFEDTGDHMSNVNRSRVSFLNQYGLLRDATIATTFLVAIKNGEFVPKLAPPDRPFVITPGGLTIDYLTVLNDKDFDYDTKLRKELYVRGWLHTGETVLCPLKDIEGYIL